MNSSGYTVTILGYCEFDQQGILAIFLRGSFKDLLLAQGEFVLVIERGEECYIFSSHYGVCNYYYVEGKGKLFHGSQVIDLVRSSGLEWKWNWSALGDLVLFEHLLGNDTLHPAIKRMPQGSILHFSGDKLTISSFSWGDVHETKASSPENALRMFNGGMERWVDKSAVVSLSAGTDSRLILSYFLRNGLRPRVVTMGDMKSTDVIAAQNIVKKFRLEFTSIPLVADDYIAHSGTIVSLTNGTYGATHWHTYLYTLDACLRDSTLFIGTNGEFAKSAYMDKGLYSYVANAGSNLTLPWFWKRKLGSFFHPDEIAQLSMDFRNEFLIKGRQRRHTRLLGFCPYPLLDSLDYFYLTQRVRNFMGNGMRLYSANGVWRAPFLNHDWVESIWNLERFWKLGKRWHRYAIQKNYPALMNFPSEENQNVLHSSPEMGYWLRKKAGHFFPYADCSRIFGEKTIKSWILDNASQIDDIMNRNLVEKIMKNSGERIREVSFLFNIITWAQQIKKK